MNSLKIQVGKLDELNCKDHKDYPFVVQISQDSLIWWPLNRFKTFDEALHYGKNFEEFIKTNQLIKLESVLWNSKQ